MPILRDVLTRRAPSTAIVGRVVVAVLLLAGVSVVLAAPSTARPNAAIIDAATAAPAVPGAPGQEGDFVARINSIRASKGLRQLAVDGQLTSVARSWAQRMASAGQISHNPSLGSQVSGNWTKLGENVGVGASVDQLMTAFVKSASHYANIVDPAWTHIGVGVVFGGDGRMYTTHNFMALPSAPPPPPPSPPTTAPPPSQATPTTARPATTTTAAPTTTTTAPPRPEPTEERVTAILDPLRSLERQ